jgi:hypothetical protein
LFFLAEKQLPSASDPLICRRARHAALVEMMKNAIVHDTCWHADIAGDWRQAWAALGSRADDQDCLPPTERPQRLR